MFPACRTTCSLVRPAEPGARLRHGQRRRGEDGPVRDVGDPLRRDPQRNEIRGEGLRDHPDRAGAARRPCLGRGGRLGDSASAGHPGLARRPAHQVLEEETVGDTETLAGEPRQDAAGQARDDPQDRVRTWQAQACQEPGETERRLRTAPASSPTGSPGRSAPRGSTVTPRIVSARTSERGVPRSIRQAG